jgi:hypothetical protein
MQELAIGALILYLIGMAWLTYELCHAADDGNDQWWEFVEQSARREKKADLERRFAIFRNTGRWVDFAAHDNGDGTTSWYAQDGSGVRYSHRNDTSRY